MILLQMPTADIFLHQSRNYLGKPEYVLIYGLEVKKFTIRSQAIKRFAEAVDHAEEYETGDRPIYNNGE